LSSPEFSVEVVVDIRSRSPATATWPRKSDKTTSVDRMRSFFILVTLGIMKPFLRIGAPGTFLMFRLLLATRSY
jgi:hypothetical protein